MKSLFQPEYSVWDVIGFGVFAAYIPMDGSHIAAKFFFFVIAWGLWLCLNRIILRALNRMEEKR